jgi:hypothetical protein
MSDGALRLRQVQGRLGMLEVACSSCERRGRLRLDRLIAAHGSVMSLPELGVILAGNCPNAGSVSRADLSAAEWIIGATCELAKGFLFRCGNE